MNGGGDRWGLWHEAAAAAKAALRRNPHDQQAQADLATAQQKIDEMTAQRAAEYAQTSQEEMAQARDVGSLGAGALAAAHAMSMGLDRPIGRLLGSDVGEVEDVSAARHPLATKLGTAAGIAAPFLAGGAISGALRAGGASAARAAAPAFNLTRAGLARAAAVGGTQGFGLTPGNVWQRTKGGAESAVLALLVPKILQRGTQLARGASDIAMLPRNLAGKVAAQRAMEEARAAATPELLQARIGNAQARLEATQRLADLRAAQTTTAGQRAAGAGETIPPGYEVDPYRPGREMSADALRAHQRLLEAEQGGPVVEETAATATQVPMNVKTPGYDAAVRRAEQIRRGEVPPPRPPHVHGHAAAPYTVKPGGVLEEQLQEASTPQGASAILRRGSDTPETAAVMAAEAPHQAPPTGTGLETGITREEQATKGARGLRQHPFTKGPGRNPMPPDVEATIAQGRAVRLAKSSKTPEEIERAAHRPYGAGPEGGVQTVAYPGRKPVEIPIDPRYAETILGPLQPLPLPTTRGTLEVPLPAGFSVAPARAGATASALGQPFIRLVDTLKGEATPSTIAGVQKELRKASPALVGQLKAWLQTHQPGKGWADVLAVFGGIQ